MSRDLASEYFDSLINSLPRPHGSVAIALLDEAGYTIAPDRLSKWRSKHHDEAVPFYIIVALQEKAGSTIATDAAASRVRPGGACVTSAAAAASLKTAQVGAAVAEAQSPESPGGAVITPCEAKAIGQAADQASRANLETRGAVHRAAE